MSWRGTSDLDTFRLQKGQFYTDVRVKTSPRSRYAMLIPLTGGHAQRPPAVEGLTALHHDQVNQVSWRRLVVRRQQKTVQGEEDFLLHHSTVGIHTGHTGLKTCRREHLCPGFWKTTPTRSSLTLPDRDGNNVKGPQTEPERSTEEDQ